MGRLDRKKSFAEVFGLSDHKYEQDGKLFDNNDNEIPKPLNSLTNALIPRRPEIKMDKKFFQPGVVIAKKAGRPRKDKGNTKKK